jgi:hypothetical protein
MARWAKKILLQKSIVYIYMYHGMSWYKYMQNLKALVLPI